MGYENFKAVFFGGAAKDTDVLPAGGYRRVIDALADGLDVRCDVAVAAVEQHGDGVTLHTSTESLTGSHVIVTIPLGVLKAGSVAFDPALPPEQVAAIEDVGFGAFEKVALGYDRAVWQTEGKPTHLTVLDGKSPQWPVVLDLSTWYGSPAVVGLAVGDGARALAGMSETEKVASLHHVIATIGGPDTSPPVSHAVTSWTDDPFLLGCYTNIAPTSSLERQVADVTVLGTPHGRVLFAGEHTDPNGTSTVDSAWRSGLREAARLLQTDRLHL